MREPRFSLVFAKILWSLAMLATVWCGKGEAQPAAQPPSDTVMTKDGKTLSGKITSMQDGKIIISTPQGPTTLDMDSVTGFNVQGGSGGAERPIDPETIDQILATQQQILQRLDALAVAFSNLEQQLRSLQTNQAIQSRRLTERTLEMNPVGKVVVVNTNLRRNGNNIVAVGQVMNQSESFVRNLQVQVTLIGSTGQLRNRGGSESKTGPVLPAALGPGQMGSFEISFSGGYVVENIRANVVGHPGQYQFPIQFLQQGFGDF